MAEALDSTRQARLEAAPLGVFRFHVSFRRQALGGATGAEVPLCQGAFAECSGLEATMEPKVIKVGGANYGAVQRAGPVSFATVVLKRGMTQGGQQALWDWFATVAGGAYAYRMEVEIEMRNGRDEAVLRWALRRALPIKFKAADLNARGTEVGIEELHLAHEGLVLVR
ncbi:MAG: phage tail protein [Thauera sp.]|jgi:phage tail-like protein